MKKAIFILVFVLSAFQAALAADSFVIKEIKVEGLQRINRGTVLNYLPVEVGDTFNPREAPEIIQALFATGFFDNVTLDRQGNTLIVNVVERPTITDITISGNKDISTDKLLEALDKADISEGSVYNPSTLDEVKQALQEQYYSRGKYNAQISTQTIEEARSRVAIDIQIDEGAIARIEGIDLIGNNDFSDKELIAQFKLQPPHWYTFATNFFNQNNQYSREGLDASLKNLQSFYMDRGYIQFKVVSTQVTLTPEKDKVYIVVKIDEGEQYRLGTYSVNGDLLVTEPEVLAQIKLTSGDIFNRQQVIDAQNALIQYYGNMGYAFAEAIIQTQTDEEKRTVNVNFNINPGQRVYVRRINFSGNTKTSDDVLRRAMRQDEAALISTENIQRSERELRQLPYLDGISSKLEPVAGTTDQVDANFEVKERSSASISFGIGLSDTDGLLLNAGLNQSNFLGTGRAVGLNFNTSAYETVYSVNYVNPFYTQDGISRGFRIYYKDITPDDVNIASYDSQTTGAQVFYGIPLTDFNNLNLGYGLENISLSKTGDTSDQVSSFIDDYGDDFWEFGLTGGWSRNTFDRIIFPTEGTNQSISLKVAVPASDESLGYYKATYNTRSYFPLNRDRDFVLGVRGQFGYGAGFYGSEQLPFYENYYAGGIGSVRGYTGNDLGPQATLDGEKQDDEALGGNILATGSVELIFPNPVDPENLRTSIFLDAGSVFNTNIGSQEAGGLDWNNVAYSVGIAAAWRIPVIGAIQASIALPLTSGDESTEPFQFNIGTSF